jgi:LytS/YehU family sensor histidine kinase
LGGGVVGAALSNDESYLPGVTALGGLLVGEAAGMAYGIHRAHRRQGRTYGQRLGTTVGAGAMAGAAGVYVLSETEGKNAPAAAIVVAMPLLQLAVAIAVERRAKR